MDKTRTITIFHSPDADDAFMFYGFESGAVNIPGYSFRHELKDIESLNHLAKNGIPEVTAISVQAYPYLEGAYAILTCGASMGGENYGPKIVSTKPLDLCDGKRRKIGVPGELTSTTLALRLFLKEKNLEADLVSIHFEEIQSAVKSGEVDCGAIIHEGQITHEREGLVSVVDLGVWWWNKTSLPLPLGVNVVRRDLGDDAMRAVKKALSTSIGAALSERSKALDYALSYGRGLSKEDADTFVGMYVNHKTVDLGEDGIRAIKLFLSLGYEAGFIPPAEPIYFV